MRTCQKCAAPIPTAAKLCDQCGADQHVKVGKLGPQAFPDVRSVAEQNDQHDRRIARFVLAVLLGSSVVISIISGVSLGSMAVGGSTFFIAVLALFVLFQVAGIDVSL